MKQGFISLTLTAAALLLGSTATLAAGTQAKAPQAAASQTKASPKIAKSTVVTKPAAKIKLVDINSASVAELKKLPGITDAEASKIVAGRPYGSKAWLVTHKIIPTGVYEGLRQQVIAKQPNKDATRNAAIYSKKK